MWGLVARPIERVAAGGAKRRKAKPKGRAAKAAPVRRPPPRFGKMARRAIAMGVVAAVLGGGFGYLALSGAVAGAADWVGARALRATAEAGITLRDILVEGRQRAAAADLVAALGHRPGAPLLAIDPAAVRERLERVAWVESVAVERRFPDVLYLRITEREPMAVWQHNGRFSLVDRAGDVIVIDDVAAYPDLPFVVGADAPAHLPALLRVVARDPEMWGRVEAAVRVAGRRWNLRLDNGIDVRLPEDDMAAAWARLGALHRRHGLLARDITVVDLRIPDRLVVRLRPGAEDATPPDGTDA